MRNLSMKKFGTPTAAAPGWASEKVGFDGAGGACVAGGGAALSSACFLSFLSFLAGLSALAFFLAGVLEASSVARGFEVFLPVVACWVCLPPVGSCEADAFFFALAAVDGCGEDFEGAWLGCADCFCVVDDLGCVLGCV